MSCDFCPGSNRRSQIWMYDSPRKTSCRLISSTIRSWIWNHVSSVADPGGLRVCTCAFHVVSPCAVPAVDSCVILATRSYIVDIGGSSSLRSTTVNMDGFSARPRSKTLRLTILHLDAFQREVDDGRVLLLDKVVCREALDMQDNKGRQTSKFVSPQLSCCFLRCMAVVFGKYR